MSKTTPNKPDGPTFALVGHCGADAYSITNAIRHAVSDARVTAIDSDAALASHQGAVLLINRVLDGRFAAESGIELIESLAKRDPKPAMALISNYADAQDAAVAAGAVRGFGKSELGSATTTETLRKLAAMARSAARTTPSPMPRSAEASG